MRWREPPLVRTTVKHRFVAPKIKECMAAKKQILYLDPRIFFLEDKTKVDTAEEFLTWAMTKFDCEWCGQHASLGSFSAFDIPLTTLMSEVPTIRKFYVCLYSEMSDELRTKAIKAGAMPHFHMICVKRPCHSLEEFKKYWEAGHE